MNRFYGTYLAVMAAVVLLSSHARAQDPPPAQDMVGWYKADAGVISDAFGILEWKDQSGNGNDAIWHAGTMAHTTADFGTGTHDVIRFVKDGFFDLPTAAFRLPDITVYAVVQQANTDFDDRIVYFSNYSNAINWGYGYLMDLQIAGGSPISRMFTSGGTQATYSDFTMPGPEPGMHFITTQIDTTNTDLKSTYVDGTLIGGPVAVPGLQYFEVESASIGTLGQLPIPSFYYSGDIAEILVYSSVSDAQRSAVESYLNAKYFNFSMGTVGDYNGDNFVDAADYTVWRDNLGTTNVLQHDPIGGTIGSAQYDQWKAHFGASAGSASSSLAAPEPGTVMLLLSSVAGGGWMFGRRGRVGCPRN